MSLGHLSAGGKVRQSQCKDCLANLGRTATANHDCIVAFSQELGYKDRYLLGVPKNLE